MKGKIIIGIVLFSIILIFLFFYNIKQDLSDRELRSAFRGVNNLTINKFYIVREFSNDDFDEYIEDEESLRFLENLIWGNKKPGIINCKRFRIKYCINGRWSPLVDIGITEDKKYLEISDGHYDGRSFVVEINYNIPVGIDVVFNRIIRSVKINDIK